MILSSTVSSASSLITVRRLSSPGKTWTTQRPPSISWWHGWHYVSEGTVIYVEKLDGNEGDKVVFDKVLMANGVVGNPYVSSKVEGVILKQGKQKKLTIFRYKPNKRSTRVKKGHRQPYTKVEIKKIK